MTDRDVLVIQPVLSGASTVLSMLLRSVRVAALGALGLAVALSGLSSAAARSGGRASKCQKLRKRFKDVAPSRRLVTVVRDNGETGRISACVLPRGKVRTLAVWDDGLGRDSGSVVDTAGTSVLVEEGHRDQYGGVARSLRRIEVRHNRSLVLSSYGCQLGLGGRPDRCPDGSDYGEAGIAPSGGGAFELIDLAGGATTLQGFSPGGALTKLADGAVDMLRVTSAQVTWKQGGIGHTAPLPGATPVAASRPTS